MHLHTYRDESHCRHFDLISEGKRPRTIDLVSAVMSGKLKMVAQCIAAAICLFSLYQGAPTEPMLEWAVVISVWLAVLMTVYSGAAYVHRAVLILAG